MLPRTRLSAALALVFGATALTPCAAQVTERIEITGSAIKRVDAEGALPITIITREEIARSGVTSTEELVNTVAAVSSMNAINNATGAGSSTNGRSSVSLRGLSGNRTLVLVNGRRLAVAIGGLVGGSVNVNNIPLAAIERVEVLKDGASSIYGSEALAGVVNFILSKDFQGIDVGVGAGTPTRKGGGKTHKADVVGGIGNLAQDRFNLTASLSAEKETQLFAKERDFSRTGNVLPYLTASATGQGNIEGAYTVGQRVNGVWQEGSRQPGFANSPGSGYGNPMAAPDRCADVNMFLNPTPSSKGAPYCTFDSNAFVGLIPERESTNLTLNGVFRFSDSLELFGDALKTRSIVTQRFQPSPVRRSFLITDAEFANQGVDPVLLIKPSNPNYQTAANYLTAHGFSSLVGQPLAITARVFDFGPRTQRDVTEQSRLMLGLRGELLRQSFEVAYSDNRYELTGTVPDGYFSQVGYARAVQNSNDWNPWSLNQSDAFQQAIAPAKYTGTTLDGTARSKVLDGRLSGDLTELPAGALSYALGLQFRDESYQTRPSAAQFSGDIAGLGGATPPVDRSRRISSLFGELVVPVVRQLEGNLAVRHDRYNDVGNADTYKASLRWQPIRTLVLRGGAGTGFRAPTLVELWLPQTLGSSAQFTDPAFPNNPQIQTNEISGGNPTLKPEKSKQQTLGLVFSPIESMTVSADYWRLQLDRLITAPSTQEIVTRFRAGDPAYRNLVTLNSNGEVDQTIAVNQNVGGAKLEGVDIDATWRMALAGGRFDLHLNGTYFIRYDQVSPGGSLSRKVGTMVEDTFDATGARQSQPVLEADGGGVVLRWKHRLSGTYSLGGFALTLVQNYYTGYRTNDRQFDGEKNFVPAQSIFDAQLAYSGFKGLRIALGVKNLADKNPPIYVPASNQFQAGYDISLYDPKARFVYGSVNYKF
jgi:iron complex outermembrane receptor protein